MFLVVIFLTSINLTVSAHASDISRSSYSLTNDRIADIVEMKAVSIGADITVDSVEIVKDFAENDYAIVSCTPKGYFIIHIDSGICTEYNLNAKSPFLNVKGEPVYGGPTYYYDKISDTYSHTILNESLSQDSVEEMVSFNQRTDQQFCSSPDVQARSYINGTSISLNESITRATNDVWVTSKSFFTSKKSDFGFKAGDYCGYIAANLVLSYWDYRGTIDLPYYSDAVDLTEELIGLGSNNLTYPWDISSVINKYCDNHSISGNASWTLASLDISYNISNSRPVILFGNYELIDAHAVVAYGYNTYEAPTGYTFICHFGWEPDENGSYEAVHVHGQYGTVIGGSAVYTP